jgi:hypothetical protein
MIVWSRAHQASCEGSPQEFRNVSVAFTKEESAETASETLLPDRPTSPHPNLVTAAGMKALEAQLEGAQEAYDISQRIEDVNERRRAGVQKPAQ